MVVSIKRCSFAQGLAVSMISWFQFSEPLVFLIHLLFIFRLRGGRRPESEPPSPYNCSAFECEVVNPVLLPALFVLVHAERFFFAETDGLDALCGDPALHQRSLHRFRPAGSEGDVVFLRSAVVTMALDESLDARMLREEGFVILDGWCLAGADGGFVVVEEHIFDVLAEQFLIRR